MTLPNEAKGREEWPIYDYQYNYFPDAYLEEVRVSWIGNQQHNPGQRMHWAREKSSDHMNKAMRHLDDYGRGIKKDTDGTYHLAKVIWRLKARLQLDIEEERLSRQYVAQETERAAQSFVDSCGVVPKYQEPVVIVNEKGNFWRAPNEGIAALRKDAYVYQRWEAEKVSAGIDGLTLVPA